MMLLISEIVRLFEGLLGGLSMIFNIFLLIGHVIVKCVSCVLLFLNSFGGGLISGLKVLVDEFVIFSNEIFELLSFLCYSTIQGTKNLTAASYSLVDDLSAAVIQIQSAFQCTVVDSALFLRSIVANLKDLFIFVGDSVALATYRGPKELLEMLYDFAYSCTLLVCGFILALVTRIINLIDFLLIYASETFSGLISFEMSDIRFLVGWLVVLIIVYTVCKSWQSISAIGLARKLVALFKVITTYTVNTICHLCTFVKNKFFGLFFHSGIRPRVIRNFEDGNDSMESDISYASTVHRSAIQTPERSQARQNRYRAPDDSDDSFDAQIDKQNSDENSAVVCVVCLDRNRQVAMFPCRHMCMCEACSLKILNQDGRCPICREIIVETCLIFI